ncbi:T6SS immunity protein Tli4 family protein, partial [Pseudomonas fulva]
KFVLGNDSTLNRENQIREILDSILLSGTDVKQALCYMEGCLTYRTGNEGVYVDINFAERPNLRAKFTSKQYGGAANQYLSERNKNGFSPADATAWIMKSEFQHRTYRNTKRTVNNLVGEEIIEASTEKSAEGYLTEVNAVWYYPGEPNRADKPEIRLDLDYSYTTKQPPKNGTGFPDQEETHSVREEEFMKIWDDALNSLVSK